MSTPGASYDAIVASRQRLSPHLVRLRLGGAGLAGFESTGIPDEWVGLVAPGQFQSRYYTVRSWDGADLTLDVVLHDAGLVTSWARGDCEGDRVAVTDPKGTFAAPKDAPWLLLVADLTGLPAVARIAEAHRDRAVRIWLESPEPILGYLPAGPDVTWLEPGPDGASGLAGVVEAIDWPSGDGYFWMAGESAQMRAIRKHLMHDRRLPKTAYDVTGYWRSVPRRQPRAIDPAPGDHDE